MIELLEGEVQRTVPASAQATVGDLKIGVGNIWSEPYTDAAGQPQEGLTTGLWFFVRDNEAADRTVRGYPGQTFEVADYHVRVLAINPDGPVVLGITPPDKRE